MESRRATLIKEVLSSSFCEFMSKEENIFIKAYMSIVSGAKRKKRLKNVFAGQKGLRGELVLFPGRRKELKKKKAA